MKKIWLILACLSAHQTLLTKPPTIVLFLRGSACAGKSSICTALIKLNKQWKLISEDDYWIESQLHIWSQYKPQEYALILKTIDESNIFHAITRNEIMFKPLVTPQNKIAALRAIADIRTFFSKSSKKYGTEVSKYFLRWVYRDLRNFSKAGFNVIFDASWFLNEAIIKSLKQQFYVYTIIAYTPLSIALDRLAKRNEFAQKTGNMHHKRFYAQVLHSFKELYCLGAKSHQAIDSINKKDFMQSLQSVETYLLKRIKTQSMPLIKRELNLKEFHSLKNELLKPVSHLSYFSIVPTIAHDLVLHTHKQSPLVSAQHILTICTCP